VSFAPGERERAAYLPPTFRLSVFLTSPPSLPPSSSYGSAVGVVISVFLIWVSKWMGEQFDELQLQGEKVGEKRRAVAVAVAKGQNAGDSTSCVDEEDADKKLGTEDEGQGSWTVSEGDKVPSPKV